MVVLQVVTGDDWPLVMQGAQLLQHGVLDCLSALPDGSLSGH